MTTFAPTGGVNRQQQRGRGMLGIAALARDKEAIVSRGQLVEIGGSFRIPDIMRESGATMVEVGTPNQTHLADYQNAITDRTGLLLKVHTSNYRIVGFTTEARLAELVELGRRRGLPVMVDQGSGNLRDLDARGIGEEPSVQRLLAAGADLVTFSGDNLLGGPQAGLVVGRAAAIARIKAHPLMRALRPDKLTLAALEGTQRATVSLEFLKPETYQFFNRFFIDFLNHSPPLSVRPLFIIKFSVHGLPR